ncbi:MAG: aminoacyl-tRNA hydrolase [Anaerolineae bacterium]
MQEGTEERRPRLVVGLGNPGPEYVRNRHNVGFLCLDRLAERHGISPWRRKHHALVAEGLVAGHPVVLAKPQTFMNLSGQAVRPLMRHYGVALADLLVVHDDLDLDLGVLRLRRQGSSAGHKGVQHIIDTLGSREFPRLRIGVGRPAHGDPVDYVLSDFTLDESIVIDRALDRAVEAIVAWLERGIEAAMNAFNAAPPKPIS